MPVGHGGPCHGLVLAEPRIKRRTELGKRGGRVVRECSCRNRGIVGCVLLHIERICRAIKTDAGYLEQPAVGELQIGKEYAVPSALEDLTSVFGMGTGVTPPPLSPGSFSLFIFQKPFTKVPSKLPQCITYLFSFISNSSNLRFFLLAWSSPRLISIS